MLSFTAICSRVRGVIFSTGPPGLMGREVLADMLGIRGDWTARGAAGTRPKLTGEARISRRKGEGRGVSAYVRGGAR